MTRDRPQSPGSTRFALVSISLLIATCLAYWPAFFAGFIWDDPDYVVNNFTLRGVSGLVDIWTNPRSVPQWYPMVFTSFWLEFQAFGLRPFVYHASNIFLHAATSIVLFRLLVRLKIPGATLAAFVFALHPLHVESVAWITERKNTLSGLFYFWAMLAYLNWAGIFDEQSRRGSRGKYLFAVALFFCAAFSKTVAGSLPAAILLVIYYVRGRVSWGDVKPLIPMFAGAVVLGLTTAYLERTHVGAFGPEWDYAPTAAGEFAYRSIVAGKAVWFYAHTIVWPANLAFIYPRWQIDPGHLPSYLFPAAALLVVVVLFVLRNRIGRGPLVCVLLFGGTLLPALGYFNVFPHRYSFVADHFQHLASTAIIVLLCAVATRYLKHYAFATGGAVALCVLLAILTNRQTRIYDNVETLWADTLAKNPNSWMAQVNMGHAMVNRPAELGSPDLGRAEDHYRRAYELFQNEETLSNLATILAQRGNLETARDYAQQAVERNPKFILALNALGKIKHAQGDSHGAMVEFLNVIELKENDIEANVGLGRIYRAMPKPDLAAEHLRIAATYSPEDAMIRVELAQALLEWAAVSGERRLQPEAIFNLETAARLQPNRASTFVLLSVAYFDAGRRQDAIAAVRRALVLEPESAQARLVLERVSR